MAEIDIIDHQLVAEIARYAVQRENLRPHNVLVSVGNTRMALGDRYPELFEGDTMTLIRAATAVLERLRYGDPAGITFGTIFQSKGGVPAELDCPLELMRWRINALPDAEFDRLYGHIEEVDQPVTFVDYSGNLVVKKVDMSTEYTRMCAECTIKTNCPVKNLFLLLPGLTYELALDYLSTNTIFDGNIGKVDLYRTTTALNRIETAVFCPNRNRATLTSYLGTKESR